MSSLRCALHRKISDAAAAVKIGKDTHRKCEGVEFNALELYYPLSITIAAGRSHYNPINPETSALRKYSLCSQFYNRSLSHLSTTRFTEVAIFKLKVAIFELIFLFCYFNLIELFVPVIKRFYL